MRFLFCLLISSTVFAQSKKDLQAEISRLQSQVASLNAEIKELKTPEVNLSDSTEQVSYCFGVVLGKNFKDTGLDSLNLDVFVIAMQDVFNGRELKVSPVEAEATMHRSMQATMMKRSAIAKAESAKFLEENKIKEEC